MTIYGTRRERRKRERRRGRRDRRRGSRRRRVVFWYSILVVKDIAV